MKRSTVWVCLKCAWSINCFCVIKLPDKYAQDKEALPLYYNEGNDGIKMCDRSWSTAHVR